MLTSQEAIINGCPRQGNHLIDDTFVKYGNDSLFEEAKTQEYVFNLARGDPKAPRVPEVLDVFPGAGGSAYLVMRRVSAPSLRSWVEQDGLSDEERQRRFDVAVDRTTAAITWLLSVKLPPGTPIGPIGGGLLHHVIFRMEEAPLNFKHTLAIERYLNEAGPWISIADDPLVLGHSDINLDNFLYDPNTDEFWMVDYGHVGVVPVSLSSYAIHRSAGHPFVKAVAERLQLPMASPFRLIDLASEVVGQSGVSTFGLDKNGEPGPHCYRGAKASRTKRSKGQDSGA